ncbi:MAG: hypothetical protein KKF33_09620 [Alphaproteobacteria bacterium]|nr:hypothetical protein [Alphaproteobacteria bacterium]
MASTDIQQELDIFLKLGDKVDFLWTRYIYVNAIAIFGLCALNFETAGIIKILSYLFYVGFCFMNYRAISNNYKGLILVQKGVVNSIKASNLREYPKSMIWLQEQDYKHRIRDTKVLFAFGLLVILVATFASVKAP